MKRFLNVMMAIIILSSNAFGASSLTRYKELDARLKKANASEKIIIIEELREVEKKDSDPAKQVLIDIVHKDPDKKARTAAAQTLIVLDNKYPDEDNYSTLTALSFMDAVIKATDVQTRDFFIVALSQLESESVSAKALAQLAITKDVSLAEMAIATLGNSRTQPARESLTTIAFVHPNKLIALSAIVSLASQGEEAIDSLVHYIENDVIVIANNKEFLRKAALDQLKKILMDSDYKKSLKLLESQSNKTQDQNLYIREIVGEALQESGKNKLAAKDALPSIIEELKGFISLNSGKKERLSDKTIKAIHLSDGLGEAAWESTPFLIEILSICEWNCYIVRNALISITRDEKSITEDVKDWEQWWNQNKDTFLKSRKQLNPAGN